MGEHSIILCSPIFFMNNVIYDIFADFKWFRKFMGGKWYLNRYIFDLGRVMFCIWERKRYADGSVRTVTEEIY